MYPSGIFSEYFRSLTILLVKLVKRRDNNHTSGTKWAGILVFCGCLFYCRLWIVLLTLW
jgi:uncharacterized membrane protein YgdD (TMEM256/DUF423 family)